MISIRATACGAVIVGLLAGIGAASAVLTDGVSASHTISTAVLQPPTSPSVARGTCTAAASDSAVVSWTKSPSTWADGYVVIASLTAGGAAAVQVTVSGRDTQSTTVGGLAFSTTYHFRVEATKGSWRSTPTANVSLTTRTILCV